MPVIAFASPKGGAGKTTAALLLATEVAQKGIDVTVIDADPQRWIDAWGRLPDKPNNLSILSEVSEQNIIDEIDDASRKTPFVIIDLEGTASVMVAYAISRSDLVAIPIQPSDMDARAASQAIRLIKQQEKAFDRTIPYAVFLTRTKSAIKTKTLRNIEQQLRKADIRIFDTQLLEREAFRNLFSFGGTLERLNPAEVYKVDDAIINARAFAGEVINTFKRGHLGIGQTREVA